MSIKKRFQIGIVIGSEPPIQTASECIKAAVEAERDGFDSVWIPDHLCDIDGSIVDPWTTLAYIAAKTEKVSLYTAVTDFQKVNPAKLAQIVATLDELSNGRISLGIGSGEAMNITPYGLEWDTAAVRVKKLEEYIQVIRKLWRSSIDTPASFNGSYYYLHKAWIDQKVVQEPYPPICVGAFGSKRMVDLIGRLGDGWLPFLITSPLYKEKLQMIYSIAKKAKRNPEGIEAASWIFVAVSSDPKILAQHTNNLKAYIATCSRPLLKMEGIVLPKTSEETDYQKMTLSRDLLKEIAAISKIVPDQIVRKVSAAGSVNEVITFLEDRIKAGANHLVINPSQGVLKQNWKALKEEIIPYLKNKYC